MTPLVKIPAAAEKLLNRLGRRVLSGVCMNGGGNNRVLRIDTDKGPLLLKEYFRNPADPRDRLGTEFGFISFAMETGLESTPRPYALDEENGLAVYEFMEGRHANPEDIDETFIDQVLFFYAEINNRRRLPAASRLKLASEACFSLADHKKSLTRRLAVLEKVGEDSEVHSLMKEFLSKKLLPAADKALSLADDEFMRFGLGRDWKLGPQDARISPSDFGFHNAVLDKDNKLRFFDFEYAGWDDPVKMICDFFCQPSVPVPTEYFDYFVDAVVSDLSDPELHRRRVRLLYPVHRLKWCCLVLNEFLKTERERRRFAGVTVNQVKLAGQLDLSAKILSMHPENHGLADSNSMRP